MGGRPGYYAARDETLVASVGHRPERFTRDRTERPWQSATHPPTRENEVAVHIATIHSKVLSMQALQR